jgi:hypothetical protein
MGRLMTGMGVPQREAAGVTSNVGGFDTRFLFLFRHSGARQSR